MANTRFQFTISGSPIVLFKSGYSPLSPFNPKTPFTVNGVTYVCGEAYYQAEKARRFKDYDALRKIMEAKSPKVMKEIGRSIRGYDDDDWQRCAVDVMRQGIREKMSQNIEARRLLLSTEKSVIADANQFDKFWGIGIDIDDASVFDPRNWTGDNNMGKLLMQVRDELKKE